jgi:hypothetical protein
MASHAAVTWHATPKPWVAEAHLISTLTLPLNLDQNTHHPFTEKLLALRSAARRRADGLPVWSS